MDYKDGVSRDDLLLTSSYLFDIHILSYQPNEPYPPHQSINDVPAL